MKLVSLAGALVGAAAGALTLPPAPSSAAALPLAQDPCVRSLVDFASPGDCIQASSVPTLGRLYPISQQLYVDSASGRVGIGTTGPGWSLTTRGAIASINASNQPKAMVRPGIGGGEYGVVETFGASGSRTTLLSTVATDPSSGAVATMNATLLLASLTTPVDNPNAGYVSVRASNVEIAGIDGAQGLVFGASKAFVQPHPDDAAREIRYVSLEGPENGVYFRGTTRLEGGAARIEVPESFRLVAREDGLTVSLTPLGPSAGLWVEHKGLDRIDVRENPGGLGSVDVDFLVMGVRSALPEHEPIARNVHFAPAPGRAFDAGELPGEYRELMVRNGTLLPDGRVNEARAIELGWRFEDGRWTGGPSASADPRAEREIR